MPETSKSLDACWLPAEHPARMPAAVQVRRLRAMYFDSALDTSTRKQLERLGEQTIVVGLPTYKNSRTIAGVMTTIAEGLIRYSPTGRGLIVVADGGSTDDTVELAAQMPLPAGVSSVVYAYQGITGKGSAVRSIMEAAELASASACVIMDADLRSLTPEWIERLTAPVLERRANVVTPLYTRDRHEVTINDLIAYPLTRMLYGRDVRQPLGAELALSPQAWRTFLARDVWETDVARFGIHIWMITVAINSGWPLYQAPLGTKTHDYKDPTVGFEPKFLQIVGTLFRMMSIYRRVWPQISAVIPVPIWGQVESLPPVPVPTTRQSLWESFKKGVKRYRRNLHAILTQPQRELLARLLEAPQPFFEPTDWATIVCDFGVVYNRGEGDPDKVALSLLPLYYARKAALLVQVEGQPWTAVEEAIHAQADAFLAVRGHLVHRWETYLPWHPTH